MGLWGCETQGGGPGKGCVIRFNSAGVRKPGSTSHVRMISQDVRELKSSWSLGSPWLVSGVGSISSLAFPNAFTGKLV